MNQQKYRKTLIKLVSQHDFELIRDKNHLVFAHKKTNRRLVCCKTPSDQKVLKNILRDIKLHEQKYLLPRVA